MPGKGLLLQDQAPKKKQLGGWAACSPAALAEGVGEVEANKADWDLPALTLLQGLGRPWLAPALRFCTDTSSAAEKRPWNVTLGCA